MPNANPIPNYKNRRVLVMGLGLFDGGVGTAKFFAQAGAKLRVTDKSPEDKLRKSLDALKDFDIQYTLGGHDENDFRNAEIVVANPAVPPESNYLEIARKAGAEIETEMNLFFKFCQRPIVGITGSNGKTTTTAWTAAMLEKGGRKVYLGGNIGKCLLPDIAEINSSNADVVLELSSFQLEYLEQVGKSPRVAVITNIQPNHLDRHKTFDRYAKAKANIYRFQNEDGIFVFNHDDKASHQLTEEPGYEPKSSLKFFGISSICDAWFDKPELNIREGGNLRMLALQSELNLRGDFNALNGLTAALAARAAGASFEGIREALRSFQSYDHRLQFIVKAKGMDCYNDSKSTTPESAIMALGAFDRPILLIAGGYDKGSSMRALADAIAKNPMVKALLLIGSTAPMIEEALREAKADCVIENVKSLDNAVGRAFELGRDGDILLLSPACASWDQFTNYEERGNHFASLCREAAIKPG